MSALQRAQWRYDNAEPEDASAADEAAQAWIEDKAEQLIGGVDVLVRPRFGAPVGVRQGQFEAKVAEHLRSLQEAEKDDLLAQARLLLQANSGGSVKSMIENVVGPSDHPRGKLYEIAEAMVGQYAQAGLEADAEDNEL